MLFRFGKIDSPLCSFGKMVDKTPLHLFYNCTKSKLLPDQLKELISNTTLPIPLPYATECYPNYLLINHKILI